MGRAVFVEYNANIQQLRFYGSSPWQGLEYTTLLAILPSSGLLIPRGQFFVRGQWQMYYSIC